MTIATRDQLINGMANNSSRLILDKASIANTVAGQFHSLWRATGQPGQAAIPAAAAVCTNALLGAMAFNQQTTPSTSYISFLEAMCSNAGTSLEIHDRIMHMGGLSGIVITAQTVGLNVFANTGINNVLARVGVSDFSDLQWWLAVDTDMGATASNATINVTYTDATTGDLTLVAVGGTLRASRMIALNSLIPAAKSGFYIRSINTVTLSASTATAGNFGFIATRLRASSYLPVVQVKFVSDWAALGLPDVANESCLFAVQIASTTTTGSVRASGKTAHG